MIENGSQRDEKSFKNDGKSMPEGSRRRLGVRWEALGGPGRARARKNHHFLTSTPAVLEPFLVILAFVFVIFSEPVFQDGFGTGFS